MFRTNIFNPVSLFEQALNSFKERDIVGLFMKGYYNQNNLKSDSEINKIMRKSIFILPNKKNWLKENVFVPERTSDRFTDSEYVDCGLIIDHFIYKCKPVKFSSDKIRSVSKIDFLYNIKQLITKIDKLYGIIVNYNGIFLNITHPLVLVEFIYGELDNRNIDYAYAYSMTENTEELKCYRYHDESEKIAEYKKSMDLVFKNLVLKSIVERMKAEKKATKVTIPDEYVYLRYDDSALAILKEADYIQGIDKMQHFVMPCDKLVKENFVPFYTWLYGYNNGTGLYANEIISDSYFSCNIQYKSDPHTFHLCCTGNNFYSSIDGIDSLKFSNLASPYVTRTVKKDFMTFARANHSYCIDMIDRFLKDNKNV